MLPIRTDRAVRSSTAMRVPFGTEARCVGWTANGLKVKREVSWTMDGLPSSFVSGTRSTNFLRVELLEPRSVKVPSKLFAASSCAWLACAKISSTEATKRIRPATGSTSLPCARLGSPEKCIPCASKVSFNVTSAVGIPFMPGSTV